jgi:hypothetical protein
VVTSDGLTHSWSGSNGDGHTTFTGKPGQSYWFWATVTTSLGWWDGGGSAVVTIPHKNHGAATD